MHMRSWIIGIVIGVVVVGAFGVATLVSRQSNTPVAGTGNLALVQQANPNGIRPVKDSVPTSVTATGNVVAAKQSNLSFDIPGVVTELDVKEGQHVEAGQVLARVDDATAQYNVQQAQYGVDAAQAALDKLLEPV